MKNNTKINLKQYLIKSIIFRFLVFLPFTFFLSFLFFKKFILSFNFTITASLFNFFITLVYEYLYYTKWRNICIGFWFITFTLTCILLKVYST